MNLAILILLKITQTSNGVNPVHNKYKKIRRTNLRISMYIYCISIYYFIPTILLEILLNKG